MVHVGTNSTVLGCELIFSPTPPPPPPAHAPGPTLKTQRTIFELCMHWTHR